MNLRVDGWVYVGSGPGMHIRIDDPTISGVHARLKRAPGGFTVEDLGSTNGTVLSGHRLVPNSPGFVAARGVVVLGRVPLSLTHPRLVAGTGTPAQFRRPMVLGADPVSDLVFDHPAVSRGHAEVISTPNGLMLMDGVALPTGGRKESRNSTWVDGVRVIGAALLHPESQVRLGVFQVPQRIVRSWWSDEPIGAPPELAERRASATLPMSGALWIGRDADNDIVISESAVSGKHAKLTVDGDNWLIEDLNSRNGTFVDGVRVQGSLRIHVKSHVVIGNVPLDLGKGKVVANAAAANRGIRLRANDVTFRVPDYRRGIVETEGLTGRFKIRSREVLDGIHLYKAREKTLIEPMTVALGPGEVVAVMGASGAGKSTLLKMLNGYREASGGEVLADGVLLRENLAHFAHRVGYVPQDDVMHRTLTVGQVMEFTGRLRMPGDSREQIRERVTQVLEDLNLDKQMNVKVGDAMIRGISGGQRRRLNMAMELLRKPELLILDEPTSGLDSSSTEEVLDTCKRLAEDGCTVVMTIHQPGEGAIRRIDNLLLLGKDQSGQRGGELIYLGPFNDVRGYFERNQEAVDSTQYPNVADYALEVASKHDDIPGLAVSYEESQDRREYFDLRSEAPRESDEHGTRRVPAVPFLRQLAALFERALMLKLGDWRSLLVQLAQPVILVVLMALLFDGVLDGVTSPLGNESHGRFDPTAMQQALFMLSAGALWLGCSNAAREIVSERSIFLRELHWGASPFAYLLSKFGIQSLLCTLQMAVLAMAGPLVGLEGGWASYPLLFATLLAAALVGTGQGLILSARSRSELMAVSLVPLTLLPQLLLSGFLPFFKNMPDRLQWLSAAIPLRWIFETVLRGQADTLDASLEVAVRGQFFAFPPDMSLVRPPVGQPPPPPPEMTTVPDAFIESIYGNGGGVPQMIDSLSLPAWSPTACSAGMLGLLGFVFISWTALQLAGFKKREQV